MKKSFFSTFICLVAINIFGQGSLTPPGVPGATMKSLSQIEPRTPISSLPYSITTAGSYYLTTNLTLSSGAYGIQIGTNNVTLDLGGFALIGSGTAGAGILFAGSANNISVRHGAIGNWTRSGVDAETPAGSSNNYNLVLEDLLISSNGAWGIDLIGNNNTLRHCLCLGNTSGGINFSGGTISGCQCSLNKSEGFFVNNATISGCTALSNHGSGLYGYHATVSDCLILSNIGIGISGHDCEIRDCQVGYSDSDGVDLIVGSIRNSHIFCCTNIGILTESSIISGCLIQSNLISGIYADGPGCLITGNVVQHNNTFNTVAYGGIQIADNNNRVEDNHVIANGTNGYGIFVAFTGYTNNVIVRNSVAGNGTRNYSVTTGNDLGPVGVAATATSPWANISH